MLLADKSFLRRRISFNFEQTKEPFIEPIIRPEAQRDRKVNLALLEWAISQHKHNQTAILLHHHPKVYQVLLVGNFN